MGYVYVDGSVWNVKKCAGDGAAGMRRAASSSQQSAGEFGRGERNFVRKGPADPSGGPGVFECALKDISCCNLESTLGRV